jgi:hypothetical protein
MFRPRHAQFLNKLTDAKPDATPAPLAGNRKARRRQDAFTRRLASKMSRDGVEVKINPDGGIHVNITKPELAEAVETSTEKCPSVEDETCAVSKTV